MKWLDLFLSIINIFSTCWNPWLIPNNGWKWWIAYRDAMSFRASHYFVSFMSEASVVAGQSSIIITWPNNNQSQQSIIINMWVNSTHYKFSAGFGAHNMGSHILWHYTVTQPHNVEVTITEGFLYTYTILK